MARNPHFNQNSTFQSRNDFLVQNDCSIFDWVSFPILVLRLHTHTASGCLVDQWSLCMLYLYFHFALVFVFALVACICPFSNFGSEVTYPHREWVLGGGPVEPLSTPLCQPDNTSPGPRGYLPLSLYLCFQLILYLYNCPMSLSTPHRLPHNTKNYS